MVYLEQLAKRPDWIVLEQSASTGKFEEVAQCYGCPHCQRLFNVRPGSGKTRGFCMRCDQPTCGRPGCDRCTPWEAAMEHMEGRVSIAAALHRIGQL